MVSLNDMASSGASIEVIVELIAKNVERRLQALEAQRGADYESKVEKLIAECMVKMGEKQPINVKTEAPVPVINVASPSVTVVDKTGSGKMKMTFERGLNGAIESATIVKG